MRKYNELTMTQKWRPVDMIINSINIRKKRGQPGIITPLEEYIDQTFNRPTTATKEPTDNG